MSFLTDDINLNLYKSDSVFNWTGNCLKPGSEAAISEGSYYMFLSLAPIFVILSFLVILTNFKIKDSRK